MNSVLRPNLPHEAGETPTSFLSRLARINLMSSRNLCGYMALDFQRIADGCAEALRDLASLVGRTADTLVAQAVRKIGPRFEWRGETMSKTSLQRNTIRICPRCLQDDIDRAPTAPSLAVYQRTIWTIDALRTCAVHQVPLVPIARADSPARLHDFSGCIATEIERIARLAKASRQRPTSAMESHLLNRIEGTEKPDGILRGFDWQTTVDACQIAGAVALYGRDVALLQLTEDEWYAAGDAGFEIVTGGDAVILELLRHLDETYDKRRSATEGPQAVYGKLFHWLASAKDVDEVGPFIDIVRNHVLETTPVGPEDAMFGKPFERRVLHSVRSAAVSYGIHPKRLRKILLAKGLIAPSQEPDERTVFNAAAAEPLLEAAADSLSMTEAERYLNAGRVQTALLQKAGFIKPFVAKSSVRRASTERAAHRPTMKLGEHNFARSDLDAFLAALRQDAKVIDQPGDDLHSIPKAAKRVHCGAGEIVTLILKRQLSFVGRLKGQDGYLSILVSVDEIKGRLHGERPEGLTLRQIEKVLGTATNVVRALVDCGYIPAAKVMNPVNRCPVELVSEADLASFRAKYVSLFEYASNLKLHFRAVQKMLDHHGIEPTMTAAMVNATFYERDVLAQKAPKGP